MALRIGVHGATGRMGRLVLEEIAKNADLSLAWALGRPAAGGRSVGASGGAPGAEHAVRSSGRSHEAAEAARQALADADVIIDFSTPEGFSALMADTSVPVVSGTTGLVPPANPAVPLLHAANFSLGVAVLARLVRDAHNALPGWDVEVVELHHNQKRDAPSGTAIRLVEGLGTRTDGRTGPRVPGEIGMHALRGGDIIGEHHVYLCGPGERLQLAHLATHRGLFAAGAVAAARWIVGKPVGLYRIEDVLG